MNRTVAVADRLTSGLWTEQRCGTRQERKGDEARLHKLVTRTVENCSIPEVVSFVDSKNYLVGHQGILPILT